MIIAGYKPFAPNARHQRRAQNFDDERPADLRVRCMLLFYERASREKTLLLARRLSWSPASQRTRKLFNFRRHITQLEPPLAHELRGPLERPTI